MIAGAVALGDYQHDASRPQANAEQHTAGVQRDAPRPERVAHAVEEPPANPQPERREWREERDLEAQRQMAQWAAAAVAISAAALGVAVFGLIFIRHTLDATREANKGFVDAARRQLRAYLAIEKVEGTINPGDPGSGRITFSIRVRMKNCGQTPAKGVRRNMEIFGREGHTFNPEEPRTARLGLSLISKALDIAPGLPFTHEYSVFASYSALAHPGIRIQGSVEYADFSGAKWRVPYECESLPFSANFANAALTFREVTQFEAERI